MNANVMGKCNEFTLGEAFFVSADSFRVGFRVFMCFYVMFHASRVMNVGLGCLML
jgi:hypothetical protein